MSDPDNSNGIPPQVDTNPGMTAAIQTFIKNSPWIAIAVLLHVMLVVLMGVIYMASHDKPPETAPVEVSIAASALDLPDPITEPPEIIDRKAVPVLPRRAGGPGQSRRELHPRRRSGSRG